MLPQLPHNRGRDAAFHKFDRLHHGGILFSLQCHQRLVIHGDDFGGVENRQPLTRLEPGLGEKWGQKGLVPYQNDRIKLRKLLQRQFDRSHHLGRPHIAPHGVDSDAPGSARSHGNGLQLRLYSGLDVEHLLGYAIHSCFRG